MTRARCSEVILEELEKLEELAGLAECLTVQGLEERKQLVKEAD